eukprot:gene6510-21812_t
MVKDDTKEARPLNSLAFSILRPVDDCFWETQAGVCEWVNGYTSVVGQLRSQDAGEASPPIDVPVRSLRRRHGGVASPRSADSGSCGSADEAPALSPDDPFAAPAIEPRRPAATATQWDDYLYRDPAYIGSWCFLEFIRHFRRKECSSRELARARSSPRAHYVIDNLFVFDDGGVGYSTA